RYPVDLGLHDPAHRSMTLGADPDHAFRPIGEITEFLHLRVVRFRTVRQRKAVRVEAPPFAPEPAEQAPRFFGQEPGIGSLAKRTIEDENARRVRGVTRPNECIDVDRIELVEIDVRKIWGDGFGHADPPGATTGSPS